MIKNGTIGDIEYILEIIYNPNPEIYNQTLQFFINGEEVINEDYWIWFKIGMLKNEFTFTPCKRYDQDVFKATLHYPTIYSNMENRFVVASRQLPFETLQDVCRVIVVRYHNENH